MYNDDDGCGGCLGLLVLAAIFVWISDHWIPIVAAIAIVIAIPLIIAGVRAYQAKKPEREAKAKAEAERKAAEKAQKERETYDRYFQSQEDAYLYGKLDTANAIIRKLFAEKDVSKREKILEFFDKYLPLITEIIEASKHGGTYTDEAFEHFTETVKTFSKNLYKANDVIDINKATLESMAIVDGLYDPYKDAFALKAEAEDDDPEVQEKSELDTSEARKPDAERATPVPAQAVSQQQRVTKQTVPISTFDVEMAIQDRLDEAIMLDDFDTTREMLDSGVISDLDIDDEVLSKVEDYV